MTSGTDRNVKVWCAFVEQGAWVPTLAVAETMWVLGAVYEWSAALAQFRNGPHWGSAIA